MTLAIDEYLNHLKLRGEWVVEEENGETGVANMQLAATASSRLLSMNIDRFR